MNPLTKSPLSTPTQVTSLGYKDLVTFHSFDKRGKSVYHANVMMAIGTDVAVVCGASVTDDKERQHLMVSKKGGKLQ